jgi:hypothetical protein
VLPSKAKRSAISEAVPASVLAKARIGWLRFLRPSIHMETKHRIYTTSFAKVYPLLVAKAEKKGRTKAEVDAVICWLTGYSQEGLEKQLKKQTDFETFFNEAPLLNPSRTLIKGVVCGVRVEDIQEPTMREIRYLDKLIDELAKGKALEKILRSNP